MVCVSPKLSIYPSCLFPFGNHKEENKKARWVKHKERLWYNQRNSKWEGIKERKDTFQKHCYRL